MEELKKKPLLRLSQKDISLIVFCYNAMINGEIANYIYIIIEQNALYNSRWMLLHFQGTITPPMIVI